MSVNKRNGFAAPYRSSTLRGEANALVNRNGILSMEGIISESGSNVIVPPFMAIQEGLIFEKTNTTSIIKPLTLAAPYYLTVNAHTAVNTDDLVFQFARAPSDISLNETILAEYDGNEWRPRTVISTDGIINDKSLEVLQRHQQGPYSGLRTSLSGGDYVNTAGLLYDTRGDRAVLENNVLIPSIASDVEPTWRRVDRIVYRRPQDSINRIGVRKLVIGGSYAPTGPQVLNLTPVGVATNIKSAIASDNTSHSFYSVGYGASFQIYYSKYSSDRSILVTAAPLVAATSDKFSVAIDSADNLHLVYEDSGDIKHVSVNSSGALLYGPTVVDGMANPSSNPQLVIDPVSTKMFIAFENLVGPSNKQIYLCTRSFTGASITPAVRITHTSTNVINPSIDVSSDLIVHMTYEDLNVIKYIVLDDIGQVVTTEVTVSANSGSQSFGTLINNASNAIVKITDNKEVFIAFLQRKSLSNYGVTIWKNGYAYMPNMVAAGENISAFNFVADDFDNDLYFSIAQAGSLNYVLVKDLVSVMVVNLQNSGATNSHLVKDRRGALLHTWSDILPGTYTNLGSPHTVSYIGPLAVAGLVSPLVLLTNQLSFPSSVVPKTGMKMIITGSLNGNNGTYVAADVSLKSINSPNDTYVVTMTTSFAATELNVSAQFQEPDGAQVHLAKSVANKSETRALSTIVPTSDTLLTRISWPGPIFLNYIPAGGQLGANSDLFGMYGDIDVDWSASSASALTMTTGLQVIDLVTSTIYTVAAGTYPMAEGEALYITLDGTNTNITPQVAPVQSLPWANPIQVLGFRENGEFHPHLFSVAGMGQLDVGEQIVLGQDLSKSVRVRLGITGESTMASYTSNVVIQPSDPYSTAISKLDQAVGYFAAMQAQEEDFVVLAGGQDTFTKTAVADWSANNTHLDIAVYVNGRKVKQDVTGGVLQDFKKTSVDTIKFNYSLPEYAVVTIRIERTGAPPIGGGVDLTNIAVNPQPITTASNSLGSDVKAWKSLFLKDTLSADVYELKIIGGVLQAVKV